MMDEIIKHITAHENITFGEVAAAFGLLLCIAVFLDRKNNLRSYRVMCTVTVLSDIADLLATYVSFTINPALPQAHFIVILLNTINYCGFGCIAFTLFKYLRSYMRPTAGLHLANEVMNGIFVLYLVCHVLNLFYPYLIDFDFSKKQFIRTPFSYIIGYGVPLLLVTFTLVIMVLHNREYTKRQKMTLTVSYLIVLAGVLVQAFVNARVLIAHGTGVIAVFIEYFALESPDYRRMSELLKESQEAQQKIREAQRARDDLFAGMTHEIRTPLNAVIGIDQLVSMEDNDEVVQVLAGKIKKEGETVLSVVNRILDQVADEAEGKKTGDFTSVPDLAGKSVLSVDDTPINLKIIEGLLGLTDAALVSVGSGQEALQKMREQRFDIVLLDHQMPGMDGMTLMKKIKESGLKGDSIIIMITGNNSDEYRRMYQDAGFDGYVTKPVRKEELYCVINSLLNGKESA